MGIFDKKSMKCYHNKELSYQPIEIETDKLDLSIYEKNGMLVISMYDHFMLTIEGGHKQCPTIMIDSDEYPTRLVVKESEKKWVR